MALRLRWTRLIVAIVVGLFATGGASPAAATPARPTVRWQQALPGWGQPVADDATAFVLTRRHDVVALDLTTGAVRWRAYTGGPGDAPLGSSIRLAGGHVIVGDDAIVAFDRRTGRAAWRFVPAEGQGAGIFLGDVAGGMALAGSASGNLYAVDTATGGARWTRRVTPSRNAAVYPPIVAADRIIVAFTRFDGALSGGLAAFGLDGGLLWARSLPAGTGSAGAIVVDGTTAIVAATDGAIRAFSIIDGRPRWRLPSMRHAADGTTRGRDIRALAVAGRTLVAGSLNGALVAYDLDTRRQRWRYDDGPDEAAALRLVASDSHVYAPYTDGSLIAVALETGREHWRMPPASNALEWPPFVRGGQVVAAGSSAIVALAAGPPREATTASAGSQEAR